MAFRSNFMLHSAGIEVSHERLGCFRILRGMKKTLLSYHFYLPLAPPLFSGVLKASRMSQSFASDIQ